MPKVSIVVRVKNELQTFKFLIEKLKIQTIKDFELVVVDNASTDGTYEFAKSISDKVVTISNSEFTHAKSTNLGVENSSGEYVYITNGHSYPKNNMLLEKSVAILDSNKYLAGIYGRLYPPNNLNDTNLIERVVCKLDNLTFSKKYIEYTSLKPGMMNTVSSIFRGDLVRENLFDTTITDGGEDAFWAKSVLKKRYKIAYDPALDAVHRHGGSNLKSLRRFLGYVSMGFK